jgi:hypothetical protein
MLNPRRLLQFFLIIDCFMIAAFIWAATTDTRFGDMLTNFLDPNGEANFDSWYASSKLLLAALMMLAVAKANRADAVTPAVISILLFAMSIDEAAMVHERVGYELSVLRRGVEQATHADWPLLYGVPALLVIAITGYFVLRWKFFNRPTRMRLFIGFAILLSGALGIEVLSHLLTWPLAHDMVGPTPAITILEEATENLGATLLVWAVAHAVMDHRHDIATGMGSASLMACSIDTD